MAKYEVNKESGFSTLKIKFQNTDLNYMKVMPLVMAEFISEDSDCFYHMTILSEGEIVRFEKQGYNTPTFENVDFDFSQLQIEDMDDVICQLYLIAENHIGESYMQDCFFGSINSHLFLHDKRNRKDSFDELKLYEKIRSFKKQNNK